MNCKWLLSSLNYVNPGAVVNGPGHKLFEIIYNEYGLTMNYFEISLVFCLSTRRNALTTKRYILTILLTIKVQKRS